MFNNPEFKRNFWLELSLHRVVAAPLLLAVILLTVGELEARMTAQVVFVLSTIVWGSYLAYVSMTDEVQKRTWDNQRMSALPPFKLVWGKLLGATLFAWYIGLPCLVLMLMLPEPGEHVMNVQIIIGLFLGAFFSQALFFLLGVVAVKSNVSALPKGLGVMFLFFFATSFIRLFFDNDFKDIIWYNWQFAPRYFINISLLVFTAWLWLGAYRTMQTILQIKIRPWSMLLFVLFLSFYIAGFIIANQDTKGEFSNFIVYISGFFAMMFVYFGALFESRDLVSIRRFLNAWKAGDSQNAFKETPYFVVLAVFSLFCILYVSILGAFPRLKNFEINEMIGKVGLIAVILMLRDIALLYYFSLGKKPQRAVVTTGFYLALLYFVLPLLLPESARGLALPMVIENQWLGIFVALLHLLAVAALLFYQHKESNRRLEV